MGKIFHISAVNPLVGEGGVEQFARDLHDAVGEVSFLFYHNPTMPPWEVATRQNRLNLESGTITEDDIVVTDGFYGLGLEGKVKRLISVCHGSYAGMLREYNINPPPSFTPAYRTFLQQAAEYQELAYGMSEVVAVSESAAYDLYDLYGMASVEVIRNGIDLDLYYPGKGEGWMEVAGKDERKGSDTIDWLRDHIVVNKLGYEGKKPERWRKFGFAVLPSRYEGGQYAALEAMASGLTIVAYKSGFFDVDVPSEFFYGTYDYYPRRFLDLMLEAEEKPRSARVWVDDEASIEKFDSEWRRFLNVEDNSSGIEDSD